MAHCGCTIICPTDSWWSQGRALILMCPQSRTPHSSTFSSVACQPQINANHPNRYVLPRPPCCSSLPASTCCPSCPSDVQDVQLLTDTLSPHILHSAFGNPLYPRAQTPWADSGSQNKTREPHSLVAIVFSPASDIRFCRTVAFSVSFAQPNLILFLLTLLLNKQSRGIYDMRIQKIRIPSGETFQEASS